MGLWATFPANLRSVVLFFGDISGIEEKDNTKKKQEGNPGWMSGSEASGAANAPLAAGVQT